MLGFGYKQTICSLVIGLELVQVSEIEDFAHVNAIEPACCIIR